MKLTLLAIVRLRGRVDTSPKVKDTLSMLRLTRKFHAVIYPDSESLRGMLQVVKDWVAWGEIDRETLKELIVRRGRLIGNKRLTEEALKQIFNVSNLDELIDALMQGRIEWHKLDDKVKPVFRLHPPKGGFKGSIKKPYRSGGELGYRGSGINELLRRMI